MREASRKAGQIAYSDLVIIEELRRLAAIATPSSAAFSAAGGALFFHLSTIDYERKRDKINKLT